MKQIKVIKQVKMKAIANRSSSRRRSSACWASKAFRCRSSRISCALSHHKALLYNIIFIHSAALCTYKTELLLVLPLTLLNSTQFTLRSHHDVHTNKTLAVIKTVTADSQSIENNVQYDCIIFYTVPSIKPILDVVLSPPQIWNHIPTAIRVSPSPDSFKRHLKTHYFASP